MKRLIFTEPDGGITVLTPSLKENSEKVMGPLTDAQHEAHFRERCIPTDAIKVRDIEDSYLPASREFRNAWVDFTEDTVIDISCEKARDYALEVIRQRRAPMLAKTDADIIRAMENQEDTTELRVRRQSLRDATNQLKSLEVSGKINDEELLAIIKSEKNKEL